MAPEPLSIVQVSPYPLGAGHEVGTFVTAIRDFDVDEFAVGHQRLAFFPGFAQLGGQSLRIGHWAEHEREVVHAGHHVDHARPVGRARSHRPDALLTSQGGRWRHFAQQRQFSQPVNRALQLDPRLVCTVGGKIPAKRCAIENESDTLINCR